MAVKLADLPTPPKLTEEDLRRIHAEADAWRAAVRKGLANLEWLTGEDLAIRMR